MFAYLAICDVLTETLQVVTEWLSAHRGRIGTRTGRRAGNPGTQAKLVLRWMRDDAPVRSLAGEAGLPTSTTYRYLHEALDVIADHAPDLHEVPDRGRQQG